MEKVKGSREMLEELSKLRADPHATREFANKIGACPTRNYQPGGPEYGELFHNCLDIINLRQQIEQSDVLSKQSEALSKQTVWIRRYTYATFALVGVTFVLVVATCLIAVLGSGAN
jgi:hypothetical protein